MDVNKSVDTHLGYAFFDDGVIAFLNEKGEKCVNIFEVALQAMIGELVMEPYSGGNFSGLMPRYFDINYLPLSQPDGYAKKAIEYLMRSRKDFGSGASGWEYNYDVYFRGEFVEKAPWVCSFGHAYALLAFVYWYRVTKDPIYLDVASEAAGFLNLPVERGGVTNFFEYDGRDAVFFEELPGKKNHIFNAHVICLIALIEFSKHAENDHRLAELIKKGLETFEAMLPLYDLGHWSRYDIPDQIPALFLLNLEGVDEIYVSDIRFRDRYNEAVIDVSDDAVFGKDGLYLSGIEWKEKVYVEDVLLRKLVNGNMIRSVPVPTGTVHNAYVYFNIKDAAMLIQEDEFLYFEIGFHSKTQGRLLVEGKDVSKTEGLHFLPLAGAAIRKGWNSVVLPLRLRNIGCELSETYHRFHIDLLKTLSFVSASAAVRKYFKRFLSYAKAKEFERVFSGADFSIIPGEYPHTAFVSVNSYCALSCKMCDIGIKDPESSLFKHLKTDTLDEMDFEDYRRMLDNIRGKVKKIAFIGTEPLFNKRIRDMLVLAKEYAFEVQLTTNSIKLKEHYKDLISIGVDELWLSVDGVGKVHDTIRGRQGLFDNIVECMKLIRDEKRSKRLDKPRVCISYAIVPPLNHLNMPLFIEYIHGNNLAVDTVSFGHLNFVTEMCASEHNKSYPDLPMSPSRFLKDLDFKDIDYLEFYKAISESRKKAAAYSMAIDYAPSIADFNTLVDFYEHPEVIVGRRMCAVPWNAIEVNPKGYCSIAGRCFQIEMGNIIQSSLEDIWYGERYRMVRKLLLEKGLLGPCLRCCGVL